MLKILLLVGAAAIAIGSAGAAQATTVTDAVGDFIPSYTGPHQADLDVTSLSISYNSGAAAFLIQSTMAGAIDPLSGGFYVIGVDTGTGGAPFTAIGQPNVRFNQVVLVQKNGTGSVTGASGGPLSTGSITIGGNALSVIVPLAMLPSTGFDPLHYAFNIWPRSGLGGVEVISDFAPNNATLAAIPEPATWSMLVSGFGVIGGTLRGRPKAVVRPA